MLAAGAFEHARHGVDRGRNTHRTLHSFALEAVPFLDMGRVFDSVGQTTFDNWKLTEGLGLRIAWSEATIIMIDYARSVEDDALYLNFNHIF